MQCKILIVISLMQSAFYSITVGVLGVVDLEAAYCAGLENIATCYVA